jgi:Holliday junction resolvase RusA-like endonuclease
MSIHPLAEMGLRPKPRLLWRWRGELQPVPLHRARVVLSGRRSWAYKVASDETFRATLQTMWLPKRPKPPLAGALDVTMRFSGKATRGGQPDLSNLVKAIEDAGNGLLWADDKQIRHLEAEIVAWGSGTQPLIEIEVREWRAP